MVYLLFPVVGRNGISSPVLLFYTYFFAHEDTVADFVFPALAPSTGSLVGKAGSLQCIVEIP